jgi:hypothetical protein
VVPLRSCDICRQPDNQIHSYTARIHGCAYKLRCRPVPSASGTVLPLLGWINLLLVGVLPWQIDLETVCRGPSRLGPIWFDLGYVFAPYIPDLTEQPTLES